MISRRSAPGLVLPAEVATFLESGLIMHMATRGPDRVPDTVLVPAVRVEEGGTAMTVFVAEALAEATLANVRDNGQVALTATRVTDNRSVQVKGTVVDVRDADASDERFVATVLSLTTEQMALIGMPRSVTTRVVVWPCLALLVEVREVFDQTPGPRAGQPLERGVRA